MRRALLLIAAGCGSHEPARTPPPAPPPAAAGPKTIALPGGSDGLFLDYLAYDPAHHRVWVPAGGSGRVDVIDARTDQLSSIEGFPVKLVERRGQKRTVGPSSATVGDGVVYVGNRGDQTVCAIDATSLVKQGCVALDQSPDGLQYVAATKEVWVTTPRDKSIRVLDASAPDKPAAKATIQLDGQPEGFAVDNARGVFFTNYEDKDQTLVIDLKSHAITKTWQPRCGEDGPKGLALDQPAAHLLVVCPDHVETLDAAHDGAVLGTLPVGAGLDAIDLDPAHHLVVAAAGRAGKLAFATLQPDGTFGQTATVATADGARNAVITEDDRAYVADGKAGAILVIEGRR
ncbi:MAG TPA: PQQ-binding-like beta-propeller repeat protein [Kofleriaceae bacterium]|nr:PQQ-binding-like beta-propeller repeat protein [Kofleriaceae bacterium]